MRLIVAEKPSVARDIASALGSHRKGRGSLAGDGWTVTWALGHLAELAPPDAYGEEYKRWRLESLPILPESFKVRVNSRTREQFNVVKGLLNDPAVREVVNACDAGREGELIFAYLYDLSRCRKPVLRLWISSLTREAITSGLRDLRPGEAMRPLEDAARSRSEADWIVGMNATRAYSVKFSRPGNVLSVGRVQTPTLKLLVDREREIESFRPEPFWTVHARFRREGESYDGVWFRREKDRTRSRLDAREKAEALVRKVEGGTGVVRKAEKKTATERPPLLHDLTELQRNANARYGFTAERTLKVAQALYEEKKLLTYPRTSSRYLSGDLIPTFRRRIEAAGSLPDLAPFAERLATLEKLPVTKRIVDDSKVTDHHAIVPTGKKATMSLSSDEERVFDLVARRFLAAFMPETRFRNTSVVTEVRGETFLSRGRVVLQAGWRELYPDGPGGRKEKEPPVLPPVEVGQEWPVVKVAFKEGETKPPPRYSESALLGAMETAGKAVEDEELRQAMKDSGLGTPATRAATIERLIKVGYLSREKKVLLPTEKGRALIDLLGESPLASPELTARWEERLARMERGEDRRKDFMNGINRFVRSLVEEVRAADGERLAAPSRPQRRPGAGRGGRRGSGGTAATPASSSEPLGTCPKCGAPVVETKKAYGCSAWRERGCKFAIWKTTAGKRVTEAQARRLLTEGRTAEMKGFKSKAGKPFSAALVLDEEHRVRLDFGEK
ncbi:topB: DNA topoisomerase III [Rubrobacter radiotolerans]|uniref:DNA topoisomerase n=1 Tax=Rubrobacter radiotolerans TaxID=42256 RepID=A0A023X4M0_RUBRA|nr:type IA DNA topoisomerase [Rubrobacter radiotolerans]AHY47417.1 topB: DNA topoisomerase III [Rubrobacter radiotolerans]MDX5894820.1 DNA topoisomerase 3 [Rubrobacter radiotolerans]SMC06825.1 DNA topoisomerase-3 [Rubrobacter radiotolerans DSM 5868]